MFIVKMDDFLNNLNIKYDKENECFYYDDNENIKTIINFNDMPHIYYDLNNEYLFMKVDDVNDYKEKIQEIKNFVNKIEKDKNELEKEILKQKGK